MQKNPSPYVHHIIDAAMQIREYIEALTEAEFRENQMVQDAVIRKLEVIGVACSKLEENFRSDRPNIPWQEIISMRNKLAHEYWDIDLEIVWQTVISEVPKLKLKLLDLITEIGK